MKGSIPAERIASKIYFIRGQKVMLDRDLAQLYVIETRVLNQAVSRNLERFPTDFMFDLDRDEIKRISQNVTSSGIKYSKSVRAFTEQGVAMLSSVLNSERAIQVNIQIMRAFTKLRRMLATHADLRRKIEEMERKYDQQFRVVFDAIKLLVESEQKPKHKIDELAKSLKMPSSVIPVKTGIQYLQLVTKYLDSGFRRSDDFFELVKIGFMVKERIKAYGRKGG
jgi:hypothetical protein